MVDQWTAKEHSEMSEAFRLKARTDPGYAIAYALLELAGAQHSVATQLKYLGNGDAATTMGAIEAFGMHIGEKLSALADAIEVAKEE